MVGLKLECVAQIYILILILQMIEWTKFRGKLKERKYFDPFRAFGGN